MKRNNVFVGVPLPDSEGLWWWLSSDEAPEPIAVELLFLGETARRPGTLHAGMGQHGWNWDQPVREMGGEWMKVDMPDGRWSGGERSSPPSVDDQTIMLGLETSGHHPSTPAKCRIRGWLFSWQAFSLGLKWWNWKPVVKARWETPTSGHTDNQLRQAEVTLSLEWLSIFVKFTITPKTNASGK